MDLRSGPLAFVDSTVRENYLEMDQGDAWGKKIVRLCQSRGWKHQRRLLWNAAVPIQGTWSDNTDLCLPHSSLESLG